MRPGRSVISTMRDWQLPAGVTRALWDSFHDADVARQYDRHLEGTHLLRQDLDFFQAHCPQPGRVIDLGAGTGRLSIPLVRQAYTSVAVDLSPEMLKVLGEKADHEGVSVPCVRTLQT